MDFKRFPSIENSYRGKFVDIVKMHIQDNPQTWVVTEKIHGANYSIWSDGVIAKAAKRSDFIRPESGERFYAHEPVFEKYKDAVIAIAKELGFPIAIYGELFGGFYNGEQATNASKIQKEVEYCPHIDWFIYDIMDVEKEGYLPIPYVHMLAETYGLTTVPVLGSYLDLDKALAHKNDGLTVIPKRFGLPDIEGNIMEGVVITPTEAQFLTNGSRIIFKNKSEKFMESKKVDASAGTPSMLTEPVQAVITGIKNNLTPNRMNAVTSKLGPNEEFPVYLVHLVTDAIEDGYKEAYDALQPEEQKFIRKAVNVEACKLVKELAYNKTKAA